MGSYFKSCLPSEARPAEAASSSISNLHRFLKHTTPRVSAHVLSKTQVRRTRLQGVRCFEEGFFSLNDLWDSFEEWSAYGVGVPILLDRNESVMQYYVPYLSGIQLYSHSISRPRLGDDSGSEMDYRDSNSETSSCDGELERLHDQSTLMLSDTEENVREAETLIFEYFESAPPSLRVPLSEKIKELSARFYGLRNLCSNDLSQSSWLSVAWYPIYRIPTGRTLKDLAACFLTYHSISTLLKDDQSKPLEVHSWHGDHVLLNAFGLTCYKLRGPVWLSAGTIGNSNCSFLQRSSEQWLRHVNVHHPDFEYFKSHYTPVYQGAYKCEMAHPVRKGCRDMKR
ncbi:hypothetical protein KP509_15G069600 [Ceratopteris richardii]|uniref:Uncharacterized protein n=1 Tax=Ceratopteris richardii TaxID=49495 RepID=A0A8T2T4J6_CERRI|nr:hypothetical protein KP509_15G069600 [Ceratopteris richardii]